MGYGNGEHAPGVVEPATAPYLCAHNILKSHARAYRLYQSSFKASQGGEVGITLDSAFYTARNPDNEEDVKAAERAVMFKVKIENNSVRKGNSKTISISTAGSRFQFSKVAIIRQS